MCLAKFPLPQLGYWFENSEDDLIFYVNLISILCKLNVWIKISDIKHWLDRGNERELK